MANQKNLALEHPSLDLKIRELLKQSGELSKSGDIHGACNIVLQAWDLLLEDKGIWHINMLLTASLFTKYMKLENFSEAKKWAEIAVKNRNSDKSFSVYTNLGIACYELEEFDLAFENFHTAYGIIKYRAFQELPKKYWEFYKDRAGIKK